MFKANFFKKFGRQMMFHHMISNQLITYANWLIERGPSQYLLGIALLFSSVNFGPQFLQCSINEKLGANIGSLCQVV